MLHDANIKKKCFYRSEIYVNDNYRRSRSLKKIDRCSELRPFPHNYVACVIDRGSHVRLCKFVRARRIKRQLNVTHVPEKTLRVQKADSMDPVSAWDERFRDESVTSEKTSARSRSDAKYKSRSLSLRRGTLDGAAKSKEKHDAQ